VHPERTKLRTFNHSSCTMIEDRILRRNCSLIREPENGSRFLPQAVIPRKLKRAGRRGRALVIFRSNHWVLRDQKNESDFCPKIRQDLKRSEVILARRLKRPGEGPESRRDKLRRWGEGILKKRLEIKKHQVEGAREISEKARTTGGKGRVTREAIL